MSFFFKVYKTICNFSISSKIDQLNFFFNSIRLKIQTNPLRILLNTIKEFRMQMFHIIMLHVVYSVLKNLKFLKFVFLLLNLSVFLLLFTKYGFNVFFNFISITNVFY
jgi:hypothetical protein